MSNIFFDNNSSEFRQTGTRPLHGQGDKALILQGFNRYPIRMGVRIGHSHSPDPFEPSGEADLRKRLAL